ncbi:MAG TPA: VWA domain-containing protein [Azospirillaceae bacterium]|nr:VWA domain-containing protein [Azospirillaceae bacterium]
MASWFEPEETIGRLWDRLVGNAVSYPRHPQAAVTLESVRPRLAVLFHALGGPGGVRLAAGSAGASGHRLTLKQKIGLGTERLERPVLDGITLQLPSQLDILPDRVLNERLYEWLAAFFAHLGPPVPRPADPLQADAAFLRRAAATTARVLEDWPGLRRSYAPLGAAIAAIRPKRSLPPWEAAAESAVRRLLGAEMPEDEKTAAILDPARPLDRLTAPRGYRTFLPVPLWGEAVESPEVRRDGAPDTPEGGSAAEPDPKRRKAATRPNDQTRRRDPLVFNRFEQIISLSEMTNINRAIEDDDVENAKRAAEDLDELTLGQHERPAATRLKLDLDRPGEAVDAVPIVAELTYPEWHYKRGAYLPDHCRVIAEPASEEGEDWRPDEDAWRRIRRVRRQFEALRPRRQVMPAQADGDDLDLSALVLSRADIRAGNAGNDRIYLSVRNVARDLAVAVLMDVSLSTDSFVEGCRVLDVEKEALLALSHGLWTCGDDHAIFTFTSRRRSSVSVRTVKDFDEPLSARVARRIQALKPGQYTRIGAALRHVATRLEERPNRHRLLLLLTDGKPNDIDHYEGRYAVEDTRVAIHEARRQGLKVFGVTVDTEARDYFPYLFGRGSYAILPHVSRLSAALPAIYRQVTA